MDALTRKIGQRLDVVDFETCLLATWEVAEATLPYARSLLASPEEAFGNGGAIVAKLLAQNPNRTLEDLGHARVDSVASMPLGYKESWTDLDATLKVTAALSDLADALRANVALCGAYDALRTDCYPYSMTTGGDIGAFAQALAQDVAMHSDLRGKASALSAALGAAVYVQPPGTSGLSIYLPALSIPVGTPTGNRTLDPSYAASGTVWATQSSWDEFLTACRQQ